MATVEYDQQILSQFNALAWRRIDLTIFPRGIVDHARAHNFVIGKRHTGYALRATHAFIDMLVSLADAEAPVP